MKRPFDTLLLLALPASGKSEIRRYLSHVPAEVCAADFHLGPTVQLDDFPYVHLMRRADDALRAAGSAPVFFHRADLPFQDGRDWATLIQLINEDHGDLRAARRSRPPSAAEHLFERIDAARARAGATPVLGSIGEPARRRVLDALEQEACAFLDEKRAGHPDTLEGKTVVIEFARGGPRGARMPLAPPYGYAYSLAQLAPAILEHAAILYVWVTPEESRRKNEARADPNDPGSILHHGVPHEVMIKEYGCDDLEHLLAVSGAPGTVQVEAHGKTYFVPAARFDNRADRTSFARADPSAWKRADVEALHGGLKDALGELYRRARR